MTKVNTTMKTFFRQLCSSVLYLCLSAAIFSCAGLESTGSRDSSSPPDPVMGDWQGHLVMKDGKVMPVVAQVIALAGGEYTANVYSRFDHEKSEISLDPLKGHTEDGKVVFTENREGPVTVRGTVSGDEITGTVRGDVEGTFDLKHVIRLSPTLGAKAPAGAITLFDGVSLAGWRNADQTKGIVNLSQYFGGNDRVAYLKTSVTSASAQDGVLELGSDDGVKVWLNGTVVHANNAARGISRGEDKVQVHLRQGSNEIMLKVTNGVGGWGAIARLADAKGKPLSGTDLHDPDGYIMSWSGSGPYMQSGKKGPEALFDIPFDPETQAADVKWIPVMSDSESTAARWNVRNGILEVNPGTGSIVKTKKFRSYHMHVEFKTPFMPSEEGQARGNSGVYMQGRYEIQVLDSYGLKGEDNDCGGIYKVAAPRVNMCAPPGQWQTYDIAFTAPRFDQAGKRLEDARLTLLHNGVMIHDNIRIPAPTGGSLDQEVNTPGGIMLQDHGNLVQFRNIWLVPSELN